MGRSPVLSDRGWHTGGPADGGSTRRGEVTVEVCAANDWYTRMAFEKAYGPIATVRLVRRPSRRDQEDPDMLALRELLVYPLPKGHYICIGGNTRLKALRELGAQQAPCKVIPAHVPVETLRRIALKDNVSSGEWCRELLLDQWADMPLEELDVEVPALGWGAFNYQHTPFGSLLKLEPRLRRRGDLFYVRLFKRIRQDKAEPTDPFKTLEAIKAEPAMVTYFAERAAPVARAMLGGGTLAQGSWAVVTAPPRRHKEANFSVRICTQLAASLGVPFYPDALRMEGRERFEAQWTWGCPVPEPNLLVFDDFVTTGSTLSQLVRTVVAKGHTALTLVGVAE